MLFPPGEAHGRLRLLIEFRQVAGLQLRRTRKHLQHGLYPDDLGIDCLAEGASRRDGVPFEVGAFLVIRAINKQYRNQHGGEDTNDSGQDKPEADGMGAGESDGSPHSNELTS
jgi:hypothetical protein